MGVGMGVAPDVLSGDFVDCSAVWTAIGADPGGLLGAIQGTIRAILLTDCSPGWGDGLVASR